MTVWYTALVVAGSTVLGWQWRCFSTASSICAKPRVRCDPLLRNAVHFAGVCLEIHVNNGYGIVNYLGVDLLHLYEQHRCGSIIRAVALCWWCCSPLALLPVCLYLVSGDFADHRQSLYEAAEMDGANAWQRFRIVRCPRLCRSWRRW